jgi:hypothetical protein
MDHIDTIKMDFDRSVYGEQLGTYWTLRAMWETGEIKYIPKTVENCRAKGNNGDL